MHDIVFIKMDDVVGSTTQRNVDQTQIDKRKITLSLEGHRALQVYLQLLKYYRFLYLVRYHVIQ